MQIFIILLVASTRSSMVDFDQISSAETQKSMYVIRICPEDIPVDAETTCKMVCTAPVSRPALTHVIDNSYKGRFLLESLPAGLRLSIFYLNFQGIRANFYEEMIPLGYREDSKYYIYNHFNFFVKKSASGEIVGLLMEPMSLKQSPSQLRCNSDEFRRYIEFSQSLDERDLDFERYSYANTTTSLPTICPQVLTETVTFTYSVFFEDSKWSSKWEAYLYGATYETGAHWIAVVNSFAIILIISGIIGHVLHKAVRADVVLYTERDVLELDSEFGWKQIARDVFAPPNNPDLFLSFVNTGLHLTFTSFVALLVLSLGVITPEHMDFFKVVIFVISVPLGGCSGFLTGIFYRVMGGRSVIINGLISSLLFPLLGSWTFFMIRFFSVIREGNEFFSELFWTVCAWLGFSFPLTMIAHSLGSSLIEVGKNRNRSVKKIYNSNGIRIAGLLAGCLPFGCVFLELIYIMRSMWQMNLIYSFYPFLFTSFVLLLITSGETSILITYLVLTKEDHRWWWLSMGISGSSGLYLFIFSIFYHITELNLCGVKAIAIYYGSMLIVSVGFGLVAGSIGFVFSYLFVRQIYTLIKCD